MYLMLADNEVLELSSNLQSYRVINPKLLPYPLYYIQNNTGFINDVRTWLSNRFLYKNLVNYKALMNSLSMEQRPSYNLNLIIKYHALAVTDSYWIRLTDDEIFDNLDLHNIPLSDTVIDVALLGIFSSIQLSDLKANVNLRGTFAKTWIRKDDGLHLYKTDLRNQTSVYSELYAQSLIDQMNIPNCQYKHVEYKNHDCTDTKCFTNKDIMLVSTIDCKEFIHYSHLKSVQHMFPKEFAQMTLVDYIIGNTDRHSDNFGLLVDSSSNEVIKFAPLFDHNISMLITDSINYNLRQERYKPTEKSFLDSAIDAMKVLKGDFLLEYEDAPDFVEERIKILKANYKTPSISTYVDKRKQQLEEFIKKSDKNKQDFIEFYSKFVTDNIMKKYPNIKNSKNMRAYVGYCLSNNIKPIEN